MELKTFNVKDIKVGQRFRENVGNVTDLADSIAEVGLLHPIVVTPDGTLIAGARRLQACKELKYPEIMAQVIDIENPREAERDENEQRVDLSPKEAKAARDYFLEIEKAKAKERQAKGKSADGSAGGRGRKKPSGKLPQGLSRAKDMASKVTGYSRRSLDMVDAVVEAAEKDPSLKPVVEKMERTRKIHPAYKAVQKKKRRTHEQIEAERKRKLKEFHEARYEMVIGYYQDLPREYQARVREFISEFEDRKRKGDN